MSSFKAFPSPAEAVLKAVSSCYLTTFKSILLTPPVFLVLSFWPALDPTGTPPPGPLHLCPPSPTCPSSPGSTTAVTSLAHTLMPLSPLPASYSLGRKPLLLSLYPSDGQLFPGHNGILPPHAMFIFSITNFLLTSGVLAWDSSG